MNPRTLLTAAVLLLSNVLLIAVDDLNDWIGRLKGHPQTVTPNINRIADGSEELYDHQTDPNEWNNLAAGKLDAEQTAARQISGTGFQR